MPKKPKIVWVGTTTVAPIPPKERRKLHLINAFYYRFRLCHLPIQSGDWRSR